MAKDIQRSIRFSKHIFDYVDGYRGSGFSEKFENMVVDAMEGEKRRNERLASLDRQIAAKEETLDSLRRDISIFEDMVNGSVYMHASMKRLLERIERHLAPEDTGA